MAPNPYVCTKNPNARKPLLKFTETLDVKHKTDVQRFGSAKANMKFKKRQCVVVNNFKVPWSYNNKPKVQRGPL